MRVNPFIWTLLIVYSSFGTAQSGQLEVRDAILEKQLADVTVISTRSIDAPYTIRVNVFDQIYNLNLRRPESRIFSEVMSLDHLNLTREELNEIENNVLVDTESQAAVRVTNDQDETHQVRGYVHGFSLDYANGAHYATRTSPTNTNFCGTPDTPVDTMVLANSTAPSTDDTEFRAKPKSGIIELRLLYDRTLYTLLGADKNKKALTEHAAIMIRAVNNIFEDLLNPLLSIRIIGIRELTKKEEKFVISNSKGCINYMLDALRSWSYDGTHNLDPSDLVALLTGVMTRSDDGSFATSGLAFQGGACEAAKLSVTREFGGKWEGVTTLAHELGHGVGAYHDFDPIHKREEKCYPKENDPRSFIMGHGWKTPNQFKFSECSRKDIFEFLYVPEKSNKDPEGQCLFEKSGASVVKPTVKLPGNKIDLAGQCYDFLKRVLKQYSIAGTILKTKEKYTKSCTRFNCGYIDEKNPERRPGFVMYPADGTPCLKSNDILGVCRYGICK